MRKLKILTVCHHTAYLYLLSKTGHKFYVLGKWNKSNRPVPNNIELVSWNKVKKIFGDMDIVIGHHVVHDIKSLLPKCMYLKIPYVQVIHGRKARTGYTKNRIRRLAKTMYSALVLKALEKAGLVKFVFISDYDRSDWPMSGEVIDQGIPVNEMYDYRGDKTSLLVVGNALNREHFDFKTLVRLREKLPIKIVGITEGLEDSRPAQNWDELRTYYSKYRAFLNLTKEPEKGYNLATLEAMATGMPVISLDHPFTPIKNGYNGFLVHNFRELVEKSRLLLNDLCLAKRLGENAKKTVIEKYHINRFVEEWNKVLWGVLEGSN